MEPEDMDIVEWLELAPETAEIAWRKASSQGLTMAEYVGSLIEANVARDTAQGTEETRAADDAVLDRIARRRAGMTRDVT